MSWPRPCARGPGPSRSTSSATSSPGWRRSPTRSASTSPTAVDALRRRLPQVRFDPLHVSLRSVFVRILVAPATRTPDRKRLLDEQLGDLDGVERGALAEVVVADEQGQATTVRRRPRPGGCARRSSGPGRRPAAASGSRSARRRARRRAARWPARRESGRANSTFIDSECPVNTGTRTHVPDTARSGMSRILRLSLRSFCSSSVSKRPSSTSLPANGSTLKAIGRANFSGCREDDRRAVVGQRGGLVDDLADLLVELVDAGEPGARHGLVRRRRSGAPARPRRAAA